MRTSARNPRLTQGHKLRHCKLVNAYDLTIAPILEGKSNCRAVWSQAWDRVGPCAGLYLCKPSACKESKRSQLCVALLDKVQSAIERVQMTPKLGSTRWGDLGINDAALRQALHAREFSPLGIPRRPAHLNPSAGRSATSPTKAGLHRKRTPYQVQLACACGSSRPVVESHIASLLSRGAGRCVTKVIRRRAATGHGR